MYKDFKKANRYYRLLIFFYLVIGGAAVYFSLGQGIVNWIINLLMFVVVAWMYIIASIKMKKLAACVDDLSQASYIMGVDYQSKNELLWPSYKKEKDGNLFNYSINKKNSEVRDAYNSFFSESMRLENNSSYKCDIADFINRDLVDVVINKNFLSLVPGVMTGLGILGTFIGLTIGLQSFNTGSASEIAESIAPLMNGIKIAFLTSIYGMAFSLLFNFIYKPALEDAYRAIDRFIDDFDQKVIGNADNDNNSQSFIALKTMQEALCKEMNEGFKSTNDVLYLLINYMKEMHADTAGKMENLNANVQKLPTEIGDRNKEALQPTLDKVMETMDKFTMNISENIFANMEKIVDGFISAMDKSLGDNFEKLGNAVEETTRLQLESNKQLATIVERTGQTVDNIITVEAHSQKIIEDISQYIERIDGLQSLINECIMSISVQLEDQKLSTKEAAEYLKLVSEYEQKLSDSANGFAETTANTLSTFKMFANTMNETAESNIANVSRAAEDVTRVISETAVDNMRILSDASDDATRKITENAANNIEKLSGISEEANRKISENASESMKKLSEASSSISGELREAAKEFKAATGEYDNNLRTSLDGVFESFDENLSQITSHLSGTIGEIEETTSTVPKIINDAYESLQKTFEEMRKKLENYINANSEDK